MVLTAAQTTAFFENAAQMGIPHATVVQMASEGIATVDDLADFDKDALKQLAENLRKPPGRIPDPNAVVPQGGQAPMIPTPAFTFGAKSQKRLGVACELIRFYQTVGRDPTPGNLQWTNVMKNFEIQWESLKDRKDETVPATPLITRTLTVLKWTGPFRDFMSRVIGVRTIPLSYVIRPEAAVPNVAPALAANQPHSTEFGSVEAELVARASHGHALYRVDNASVYHYIEEATRDTMYAPSIKPFQRMKDGRGAWLALTKQYAGIDKLEAEIERQEQVLHTRKWKGQSNFALEKFISQHRSAYVSLANCAEEVNYQLPNKNSRAKYLLAAIDCSDAELQAAMASIRQDSGPNGMRNDFEAAAAHLLPADPVARKRIAGAKRASANISAAEAGSEEVSATTAKKPSIGKTGVHLRYHTQAEYKALSKGQRDELRQWRELNPSVGKSSKKPKADTNKRSDTFTKKQVAAMVADRVDAALKKVVEDKVPDDGEAYVTSLVEAAVAKATKSDEDSKPAAKKVTLKSILKSAKNGSN